MVLAENFPIRGRWKRIMPLQLIESNFRLEEIRMKTVYRSVAFALFLTSMLLAPTSLIAQSAFDGTWRTNLDQSKYSPKPIVFSVKGGMYDCTSCGPQIHVKADGKDQSVTGQSYDTVSVREVDPKSIEIATKKNGKPVYEQTRTVSADGNTLTVKTTSHRPDSDQTTTAESTLTRIGKTPAGANGTSGSWRLNKVSQSENALTTTYKTNGGELAMSTPTGESYTAKLDGKDYPVKGAYGWSSVSLKRIDDHTIEETDKRDGTVTDVSKMSVGSDGKTMTVVDNNKLTGRVSTYVATKQ
jgi:hypothetical protein